MEPNAANDAPSGDEGTTERQDSRTPLPSSGGGEAGLPHIGILEDPSSDEADGVDEGPSSAADTQTPAPAPAPTSGEDGGEGDGITDDGITERRRSKMPVRPGPDRRASRRLSLELADAEKLAEANTKKNKLAEANAKKNKSVRPVATGPTASQTEESSLKKSFKAFKQDLKDGLHKVTGSKLHMRSTSSGSTSSAVGFKPDVKVKVVDCSSDGEAPEAVPRSPTSVENLRPGGAILDEAEKEAARVKKAQLATAADIDRRIAISRRGSGAEATPGQSALQSLMQLSNRAVDELDRLHISRGEAPTDQGSSASAPPGQDHGERAPGNEIQSAQAAETAQTGQASGEESSSHPSAQAGQENLPPTSRASPASLGPSNSPANDNATKTEDGVTPDISDFIPPSDRVVRSQHRIVYDQDPYLAIQSLHSCPRVPEYSLQDLSPMDMCAPGDNDSPAVPTISLQDLLNNTPVVPTTALQDVSPAQSQQHEQQDEKNDRAPSQLGLCRFFRHCLRSLDELGEQWWPGADRPKGSFNPDNADSSLEAAQSPDGTCSSSELGSNDILSSSSDENDDNVDLSSNVRKRSHQPRRPRQPPPPVAKASKGSLKSAASSGDVSTIQYHTSPPTHNPCICLLLSSCFHGCTRDTIQIDWHDLHGSTTTLLSGSQTDAWDQLNEIQLGLEDQRLPTIRNDDLFGKTLEEAYSTSCMTQSLSSKPEKSIPGNAGRWSPSHFMDSPLSDVSSTAATSGSAREADYDIRTRLLRPDSMFGSPIDLKCKVKEMTGETRLLDKAVRVGQPFNPETGSPIDLLPFTPLSPALGGSGNGARVPSDIRQSQQEPNRKEDLVSSPQASRLSSPSSATTSSQYTPTRIDVGSSDNDLHTMCEEVLSGMPRIYAEPEGNESLIWLPRGMDEPCSSSTSSSEQSIITALHDSENPIHCEDSVNSSSHGSRTAISCSGKDSHVDSVYNSPIEPAIGISNHSSGAIEPASVGKPLPLPQKRADSGSSFASGLSIITTFSSDSKTSAASKASNHSGSSSGSSGSSTLPFGLDDTSQSWRPHISKSLASVGVDQEFKGSEVDPFKDSSIESPLTLSGCSSPNIEAMRKFIMKHPTTHPEKGAAKNAKKMEVRRVVKKRSSLGNLWGTFSSMEEPPQGSVFAVPVEMPEQSSGSGSASARLLTTDEEGVSPFHESASFGDVD